MYEWTHGPNEVTCLLQCSGAGSFMWNCWVRLVSAILLMESSYPLSIFLGSTLKLNWLHQTDSNELFHGKAELPACFIWRLVGIQCLAFSRIRLLSRVGDSHKSYPPDPDGYVLSFHLSCSLAPTHPVRPSQLPSPLIHSRILVSPQSHLILKLISPFS